MTPDPDPYFTELEQDLLPLSDCDVECDGMTYIISMLLHNIRLPHVVKYGCVIHPPSDSIIVPHYWIEIGERVIDLRLRYWIRDRPDIPHGIFNIKSHDDFKYSGSTLENSHPLDFDILDSMTDGLMITIQRRLLDWHRKDI